MGPARPLHVAVARALESFQSHESAAWRLEAAFSWAAQYDSLGSQTTAQGPHEPVGEQVDPFRDWEAPFLH